MLREIVILCLIVLSLNHQDPKCEKLEISKCNSAVGCYFDKEYDTCFVAVYKILSEKRKSIDQSVIFNIKPNCNDLIGYGDFKATQTFMNMMPFTSWCFMEGISKIEIFDKQYKEAGTLNGLKSFGAIIFPSVKDNCVLMYSRKNYRGDSWKVCKPIKLNGQHIRSIMIGNNTTISLYDKKGRPFDQYQQIDGSVTREEGIRSLQGYQSIEFILLEKNNKNN